MGQNIFVSVLHPCNKGNIVKSMTIWKLCERSSKWDVAGCPNFIRLEVRLGWRRGGKECQNGLRWE